MKSFFTISKSLIIVLFVVVFQIVTAQTTIFSETFESGTANASWGSNYKGEETVIAKPMANAPKALTGGGSFVGLLQDLDGTFTGSAVATMGALDLKDYSIEADVYCYVGGSLSSYSGLVVYADSAKKDFYKMRSDFDASARINFSGLKSDPNTFLPLFSKDFKAADILGGIPTVDNWHKMKVEVRTISATKVGFWAYFDGQLLVGCPIYDTVATVTAGKFGLYSFQQSATGLATYVDNIIVKTLPATPIFSETFESGTANASWGSNYKGEETVIAKPMANAPKALTGGGSFVGLLQDLDGTFTGSAVATMGALDLKDYSIEADVYCYVGGSLSSYSGLVVYADSAKKDFYKMRSDFDASARINFSGLKSDPNTFLPLFSKDFKAADILGGIPTVDNWHKMKVEVRTISATKVGFWAYFDGQLLVGCPIYDTVATVTAGKFGLYSFQQSATGLATYVDNIVVRPLATTSVHDNGKSVTPNNFDLLQNYPNPFNPETRISYRLLENGYTTLTIHDQLGRTVKTLVSQRQSAGEHAVSWNGKDESGNSVSSGIYFYSLNSGKSVQSKKMVLLK